MGSTAERLCLHHSNICNHEVPHLPDHRVGLCGPNVGHLGYHRQSVRGGEDARQGSETARMFRRQPRWMCTPRSVRWMCNPSPRTCLPRWRQGIPNRTSCKEMFGRCHRKRSRHVRHPGLEVLLCQRQECCKTLQQIRTTNSASILCLGQGWTSQQRCLPDRKSRTKEGGHRHPTTTSPTPQVHIHTR